MLYELYIHLDIRSRNLEFYMNNGNPEKTYENAVDLANYAMFIAESLRTSLSVDNPPAGE